jgi:hypothetical protein
MRLCSRFCSTWKVIFPRCWRLHDPGDVGRTCDPDLVFAVSLCDDRVARRVLVRQWIDGNYTYRPGAFATQTALPRNSGEIDSRRAFARAASTVPAPRDSGFVAGRR